MPVITLDLSELFWSLEIYPGLPDLHGTPHSAPNFCPSTWEKSIARYSAYLRIIQHFIGKIPWIYCDKTVVLCHGHGNVPPEILTTYGSAYHLISKFKLRRREKDNQGMNILIFQPIVNDFYL